MNEVPSWAQWAIKTLSTSPYAGRVYPGLELQFEPIKDDDDLLDEYQDKWLTAASPYPWRVDAASKNGPLGYHPQLVKCWGTNWRDYERGLTVALFLDFDHGHGHNGLDDAGIAQVDDLATRHPAILNVTSKGGRGRGWVVKLTTPLPAADRKQHARNCKAARDTLSAILGVDLSKLTCAAPGSMQYVWHYAPAEGGFRLLHPATDTLAVEAPPPEPETETHEYDNHGWDETHTEIFEAMRAAGWPVNLTKHEGKPMVQLHTCGLDADYKKNRRAGRYSTNSPGTHKDQPNAHGFPRENGGIAVYRKQAEKETKDWHNVNGKVSINYNMPVSYDEAVKATGKVDRRGHGIIKDFPEFTRLLGIEVPIPAILLGREITVRRDNTALYITIPGDKEEAVEGWHYNRKNWEFDLECFPDTTVSVTDRIRQTTDKFTGKSLMIQVSPDNWKGYGLTYVKTYLEGCGLTKIQIAEAIKDVIEHSYEIVDIPFAGEYPGPGLWNRFGAKFRFDPIKGAYPHIQMILDNCGKNLTPAVLKDEWCKYNGVNTGGDYLKVWGARMYREPDKRLPGLALFSELQNTGKSTFPRTLARNFKDDVGWCELRKEVTRDDFNDQMRGAALCLLEETDLSTNPAAYQIIKNLIDNPYLKMRGIFSAAETVVNYCHVIHTFNDRKFGSIYPGDTRITMIRVDPYTGEDLDWSETLRPLVDGEMPAFLYDLMNMKFPKGVGRLYLPVLETEDKKAAMEEKRGETSGWYSDLLANAERGWIEDVSAKEVFQQIVGATTDRKFPKSAAALAICLTHLEKQLIRDGYTMTIKPGDKKKPALYTIGMAL